MATTNINTYGHRLSLHDALPLCCAAQVASLDAALVRITAPVILVAHSGGVITVAHWARNHARAIHGALLATPPDFDSPLPAGYPSQDQLRRGGWLPVPRLRLNRKSAGMGRRGSVLLDYGGCRIS